MAKDKVTKEEEPKVDTLVEVESVESKPKTTKAGKKSAKAQAEATKESERKAKIADKKSSEDDKPKHVQKTRTVLERKGKNYRDAYAKIDHSNVYSLEEGLKLAIETNPAKFDATVEMHIKLGVDPKQADQNIRDTLVLPSGTGKNVRVAVFGEEEDIKVAKAVGADVFGSEDFLQLLDKEQIDFDVLIATPKTMPKLGKYARLLGPKGLMPNPKSGTVTTDIKTAVSEAKAGKVEYRVDSSSIVHIALGKVSFGLDKLLPNINAVASSIKANKPSSVKGNYIRSVFLTTSMGPSIKVTID